MLREESLGREVFCGSKIPGRVLVIADLSWMVVNWTFILL